MEMFYGSKWQQHYFSFIFGIVAPFFEFDIVIDLSSEVRGQNFSSVKAEVVAHRSSYFNQHAACD